MNWKSPVLLAATAICIVGFSGCNDDDDDKEPSAASFDKEAMLQNIGENVIIQAYRDFSTEFSDLEQKAATFDADRSASNLLSFQDQFKVAYTSWQRCKTFEFGPAADVTLRSAVNVFPTDTAQINDNISTGTYNLETAQNADAIGMPAIDYVLFRYGKGSSAAIMMEDEDLDYIIANLQLIREKLDQVIEGWTGSNDYLSQFSSNTTASVGSPIGNLVNEINYDFELIKNAKIGIPLGKKTLGVAQPEKVEALYSGISVALAIENLDGIENAFKGGSGSGLDDYLDALDARYNDQKLSEAIIDGFADAREALNAINGELDDAIQNDPSTVDQAHTAIQNLVVLLKTDMPSQLGVQITYQDNDGD